MIQLSRRRATYSEWDNKTERGPLRLRSLSCVLNFGERRTREVRREPHRRASGSVKLHSWVTALGQQGTKTYAEYFCVFGLV
jgi:hypothetical protein